MEAQKYPADYDGIVAGAAANNRTRVHMSILWNFAVAQREPGSGISAGKLAMLGRAVLAACDARDGWLEDPMRCRFDPASLRCTGVEDDGCLTQTQVETVEQIYKGPVNPRTGEQIYPGTPQVASSDGRALPHLVRLRGRRRMLRYFSGFGERSGTGGTSISTRMWGHLTGNSEKL